MQTDDNSQLESMAALLESSGSYKVLRKLASRPIITPPDGEATRVGLFVDVETTGLEAGRDEIIELAMVPFTYGLGGHVYEIGTTFERLREPSHPIPERITMITGITDEMVRGRTIDPDEVAEVVSGANLIIAHNANFDRPFLEAFHPIFASQPWACSLDDIDWAAEGYESTKLVFLAAQAGFFYDKHRATNDCLAAIELLSRQQPISGRTGLQLLLERARTPYCRIWATSSPFELKDELKARGYKWNGNGFGPLRAWYIDVPVQVKDAELAFLATEIYGREVDIPVRELDPLHRFTTRV